MHQTNNAPSKHRLNPRNRSICDRYTPDPSKGIPALPYLHTHRECSGCDVERGVEDERPEEGEAPDVFDVVEIAGDSGPRIQRPVERWKGRSFIVEGRRV